MGAIERTTRIGRDLVFSTGYGRMWKKEEHLIPKYTIIQGTVAMYHTCMANGYALLPRGPRGLLIINCGFVVLNLVSKVSTLVPIKVWILCAGMEYLVFGAKMEGTPPYRDAEGLRSMVKVFAEIGFNFRVWPMIEAVYKVTWHKACGSTWFVLDIFAASVCIWSRSPRQRGDVSCCSLVPPPTEAVYHFWIPTWEGPERCVQNGERFLRRTFLS